MTTFSLAGRYFNDLRAQDPSSKLLIVPTGATIKNIDGSTATIYTDATMATTASNPVSTGVAENSPGISAGGNLLFFAYPGDYQVVMTGRTLIVPVPANPADVLSFAAGSNGVSSIRDNGGTTYTQPTVNFQNLRAGKIVNNTGASQIDVDLGDAQTFQLSANQTVNNTTTLTAALSDFAFPLVANRKYLFEGDFYFTSTNAAGVKFQIQGPNSSTTMYYTMEGPGSTQTNFDVSIMRRTTVSVWNNGFQSFAGFDSSNLTNMVQVRGGYMTTTSAGTLAVKFGQIAATAVNTVMLAACSRMTVVDIT